MQKTSIKLVKILQKAGFEAYWAGGCVRDMLTGKEPKDYDIVTSAKPDEIEQLLSHTIPIGKKFGVILALENNHHFEIATFRSDSGYSDGRRPDAVTFTSAKEDAFRRDFTINGLFYDPIIKKLYDFVGGEADLKAGLIRFIGDPAKRIQEDHLRIMRAIRFKACLPDKEVALNFQYHPDTYQALLKNAALVDKVSAQRLRDELNKIMLSNQNVEALKNMEDLGILKIILPEIQAMKGVPQPYQYHHEGDVFEHSLQTLQSLPLDASLSLRWASLLHDCGKPPTFKLKERIRFDQHAEISTQLTEKILKRLAFPSQYVKHITWLVEHHMLLVPLAKMTMARRRHWYFKPHFAELMELFKADILGTNPADFELYNKISRSYQYSLKTMPAPPKKILSGEEIMQRLNLPPGKLIGEILEHLRHEQLAKKIKTKKQAIDWLNENFSAESLFKNCHPVQKAKRF